MKILAINPGSTSTKYAIYEGCEVLFEQTLRHSAKELSAFGSVVEQMEWRRELIIEGVRSNGVDPLKSGEIAAVVGRGGIVKPIDGGIYGVNDTLVEDTRHALMEHASNLGALLARSIADAAGVNSYIVDPVVVDELEDVARISGHPKFPRRSMFHALNSRAIAKRYASECGKCYEELNIIVVHMGGGVSVSAHKRGRVVDVNNAISGDGTFSPERAGRVEPMALAELCFSGEYTKSQVTRMLIGDGGLVAHLGSNSMYDSVQAALKGDEKAKLIVDAFCYNVAKDVGAMATVMSGDVDAILITGGIAQSEDIVGRITDRVKWITEVKCYAGEDELGALVGSVVEVLEGRLEPKEYI
ncbi:MAG: butyrate kinase [Rikenellaceae bacterium]